MSDGETSGGMEARVVAGAWADRGVICAFGTACAEPCVFARLVERLRAQERLAVGRVDGRSGALFGPASFGPERAGMQKRRAAGYAVMWWKNCTAGRRYSSSMRRGFSRR